MKFRFAQSLNKSKMSLNRSNVRISLKKIDTNLSQSKDLQVSYYVNNSKFKEYGLNNSSSHLFNANAKSSLVLQKSILSSKKEELKKEIERIKTQRSVSQSMLSSMSRLNNSRRESQNSTLYLKEYERKNRLYQQLKQKYLKKQDKIL